MKVIVRCPHCAAELGTYEDDVRRGAPIASANYTDIKGCHPVPGSQANQSCHNCKRVVNIVMLLRRIFRSDIEQQREHE